MLQGDIGERTAALDQGQQRPGGAPFAQLRLRRTTERLLAKPAKVRDRDAIAAGQVLQLFTAYPLLQQKAEQLIALALAQQACKGLIIPALAQGEREVPEVQRGAGGLGSKAIAQPGPGLLRCGLAIGRRALIDEKLQLDQAHA